MKVLHLTFEYKPVVKLGGLAEVPYNLATECAKMGHDIRVFMPAHGRANKIIPQSEEEYKLKWSVNNNIATALVKIITGVIKGVRVYLASGKNSIAADILDDPAIYTPGKLEQKSIMFANVTCFLCEKLLREKWIPDVVHVHDWHSIPAALVIKEKMEENGHHPGFIYTVHLLSKVRFTLERLEKCRIRNMPVRYLLDDGVHEKKIYDILNQTENYIESMGAIIFDMVTSVSNSYLKEYVEPFVPAKIRSKASYIYNGTDWELDALRKKIARELGDVVYDRKKMRELVTTRLVSLKEGEPIIVDEKLRKIALEHVTPPFRDDLSVEPFESDGPLVIATGRLSKQKGIDILLDAVEIIVGDIPNLRVLLMVLPISGEKDLIPSVMEKTAKLRKNVRCILGIAPSLYIPAHLAADVYACPSRWEPFGIMALEGMACGIPIATTRTGGLQETVIDIREDPLSGTGLLADVENVEELAYNLKTLVLLSQIAETGKISLSEKIPYPEIVKIVKERPQYFEAIRKNCIRRVRENFTWHHAALMALKRYRETIENAKKRL